MWLILIAGIIRSIVAATTLLGNDEVYYVFYPEHLQLNYFDHPLGIALFLKFFTLNGLLNHEFFIRLGSIICSALNTWIIYKIGSQIKDERTGWFAALLYNASIYCSIIAGIFILPDSPQTTFWLLGLLLMHRLFFTDLSVSRKRNTTLLLGICIGLCTICKIHGVFLWLGAGLYIVFFNRKWLSYWWLYVAVLITLIIISPILIWNIQNDFIMYRFQGGRVDASQPLHYDYMLTEIAGEFFYNNIFNVVMIIVAVVAFVKKKIFLSKQKYYWILFSALPIIIIFWIFSLRGNTLPHWSGPGYMTLLLLAAAYWSDKSQVKIPFLLKASLTFILIVLIGGVLTVRYYPGTLGNKDEAYLGDGDFTLDMYGWNKLAPVMDSIYQKDLALGKIHPDVFLTANKWFPAAHINYYVAQPLKKPFYAIGDLIDIHHYKWLNEQRKYDPAGKDAYAIVPSNMFYDAANIYNNNFLYIDTAAIVPQYRSGALVRKFYVIRLHQYRFVKK